MNNRINYHRAGFIVLSMTFIFIAGCYEFDYVNQQGSAQPDSSFVVQISATTTDSNGNHYIPYFGVLLPVGWSVQDSIGFICDSIEGTFVYSDSLSLEMGNLSPPPENYFWWVGAGVDSVIYNLDDTYIFNPVILTDGQTGHFYLSYMLGSNSQSYGGLGERISGNHLITIGLPASITVTSPANDGPGSLREAIDNIDFYGTITFDLDQNDTIKLAEPLEVKKDCRIAGPVNNTLVISGNDVTRIFHISSSPEISNLLLTRGFSDYAGGAIYCDRSSPVLKDLIITGNTAKPGISDFMLGGGGIYCDHASPILENVTISNNSSNSGGGGIFFHGVCNPVFDSIKRCDIYMNRAAEGNDIFVWSVSDSVKVVLDTFSVLNPTGFHAAPLSSIDFDILHGKIEQSNSDLYVSPGGNNSNNGLSAETPLRNIHAACVKILADSLNPHTIHLSGGMYIPSLNGELFPVCLPDYVNLAGDTVTETVLDGEGMAIIVSLRSGVFSSHRKVNKLSWLTLKHGNGGLNCYKTNSHIENVNIADNTGGVSCQYSDMIIENCTIVDNKEGGLYFESSSPLLENVMISRNGKISYTGGIRFVGPCNAVLHNVSIIGNSANEGGGIVAADNPVSIILNNVIIRDNLASWGGGIYCERSDFYLSDVTIVNNTATLYGGGICYVYGNDIQFDTLNRCNIHSNRAFEGNDFYNSPGHIVVDTFSVLNPTKFHVFQTGGNTTYDILHGKYAQTDSDLFVSPAGDNNNSGLTPAEPLKNIHCAMSKMLPAQPRTIRLLDGVYSPSGNNEFFPVRMYNIINISGASKANVILDAEQTGRVIHVEKISSRLSDMTITGGEASSGGGIECRSSSLSLKNLLIKGNNAEEWGGGLVTLFCNPVIEECDFIANSAGEHGGGLSFIQSKPVLTNVRVSDNLAISSGGGIYCQEKSQLTMKNVSICRNTAMDQGGGIYTYHGDCELLFDETDRCNIYFNRAAEGGDICFLSPAHIVLDTFTVMNPMKFHASPLQNFTFDIRNSLLKQASADLYVSPGGDNSKSGLSETEALKDIFIAAMKIKTESTSPRAIHLLEGTYSSSFNTELFPVFLPDYSSLKGASPGNVILDAEKRNTVVRLLGKSNIFLSGMTIKGGSGLQGGGIRCEESNLSLKDIVISDNEAWRGGGIYAEKSTLSVHDAQVIKNTSGDWKGNSPETPGIYMILSDAVIENSVIAENEAHGFIFQPFGIGLDCIYSGLLLRNSTITGNTSNNYASYQPYWPAGISFSRSKPLIINSIIFGNYPKEIHFETYEPDTITVSYSDIRGGMGGIILSGDSSYLNWLEGNIVEDPLFAGEGEHPFMLSATSPCRNAGTPDTTGMLIPLADLAGGPRIWDDRIDIGAYEWNNVSIDEFIRDSVSLQISVFPNPFCAITTIRYYLEENGPVMIRIFNLRGQQIAEPLNARQKRGIHEMKWKAKDLPSGIYLYRIYARNKTGSAKLVKQ